MFPELKSDSKVGTTFETLSRGASLPHFCRKIGDFKAHLPLFTRDVSPDWGNLRRLGFGVRCRQNDSNDSKSFFRIPLFHNALLSSALHLFAVKL